MGKKATSEDNEVASYSLFEDKEIFDCLVNLPCLSSCKKRKKRGRDTDTNQHWSDQCYLNLPEDMVEDNPLDIENIKERQDEDNELQQLAARHPEWYSHKTFNYVDNVLCYTKPGDDPSNWKIALPKISMVSQKLEGFTFATALDLNMGHYTISLDLDAGWYSLLISLCPETEKYSDKLITDILES